MSRLHVVPENDLREHVVEPDGLCSCLPRSLTLPSGKERVVHNSYDRRETGEVCRLALDLLGCALAEHWHDWTPEEREAFEHAILVLDMHWPAKPAEPRLRRPF